MKKNIFMRTLLIVLLILFYSCNSLKVREFEMDTTQELIGDIKKTNVITIHYSIKKDKDSISWKENTIIYYNRNNQKMKQIDVYPNLDAKTVFKYNDDGLIRSIITKYSKSRIAKIEYIYDKKKNVIIYNQLENDTLYFSKKTKYDRKNNRLEQERIRSHYKRNVSLEKFTYDYKNDNYVVKTFHDNNSNRKSYLKVYFDKKGYIIRTETIDENSNQPTSFSTKEYDRLGNLSKQISYDNLGNVREFTTYKNTYDAKGNIIIRDTYLNDKLFIKSIFEITYW